MTRPFAAALLLALAACAGAPPEPTAADPCGATGYAGLVGRNIAAVTLPADLNARIIRPDTAVTMDFRPDRLNVDVQSDGTITGLRCG
ncbi:I78 family peptidase inhibitor [Jannaschia sp. W003]|uniref:I78 family peptidase inhibitor n=1 Tax=Jannaschia sp. W003 TaxID=2867012 RepID=UPI0021A492C2|nr:I78 family peptidase inhibitor [Jannaschia sp. W003]UWQ21966.1 hypothetical protein K3554_02740 [Jannaschia sp. W003]